MATVKQYQTGTPKAKVSGSKRDSKTGRSVIGPIAKKGNLPVNDKVVTEQHILFRHAVTVDPEAGQFITYAGPHKHWMGKDEINFSGGRICSDLKSHRGNALTLGERDEQKSYAFYTPSMSIPQPQKPYRLIWNVGEQVAGAEIGLENWGSASTGLPMIMSGTGEEVAHVLNQTRDARVVAVRIENGDEEQADATQHVFALVAEFLPQLIEVRQKETLKKIIESFMPSITPSASARAQIQMLVTARASILGSGDFIPPKEVAELANYSATNPSVYPNKWKQSGKIFAIQNEGNDYFPRYALDPNNKFQPRPQVAEVLRVFGKTKDSWATALWFASLNSFLDDEKPKDVLATDPDHVVEAAKDEMVGIQHG